jgi:hypothetical protein
MVWYLNVYHAVGTEHSLITNVGARHAVPLQRYHIPWLAEAIKDEAIKLS